MRLSARALRTRSLVHVEETGVTDTSIDVPVLRALFLHRPSLRVLPQLQELVWRDHRLDSLPYLHLFLSSDLTRLEVRYPEDRDIGQTTFNALSTSCPNIKYLKLLQFPLPVLSRMLILERPGIDTGFSQLESLAVNERLPEDVLSYLSTLASLKHLEYSTDEEFPQFNTTHPFPSLCDFKVTLWLDFDPVQNFFEAVQLPNLTTLTIVIYAIMSRDQTLHLYNSISKFKTLTKLSIDMFPDEETDPDVDFAASIASLLTLRRLHTLSITHEDIRLGDDMIAQLAKNLPDLRVLRLVSLRLSAQITLTGLRKVATLFPQLEQLTAEIDFGTISTPGSPPARSFSPTNSRLRRLCVGYSIIHDTDRVAAALSAWFPNLQDIVEPRGLEDGQRTKWKAVRELIDRSRAAAQVRVDSRRMGSKVCLEHFRSP
ncbi:hypothetical protein HGRIS_006239 [Hohenbuehelia grisea]|uniref:Uncharacterized protein n=1 Tax=Hohenbuehelia grisea TaxID=104357 RepID=A0ABR3JZB7_9AGAR